MSRLQERESPLKVITVDGPAGSGKSSLCAKLAERLGWAHLNTGAIYRALGLYLVDGRDEEDAVAFLDSVEKDAPDFLRKLDTFVELLCWDGTHFFIGEEALGEVLYGKKASLLASRIASVKIIREKLIPLQRSLALACPKGVLIDGRDIGTIIFPDAPLKFFLTASLEERAKRRLKQIQQKSENPSLRLETIMQEIANRDYADANRDTAPLKAADDARLIDTTGHNLEESIELFMIPIKEMFGIDEAFSKTKR